MSQPKTEKTEKDPFDRFRPGHLETEKTGALIRAPGFGLRPSASQNWLHVTGQAKAAGCKPLDRRRFRKWWLK